MKKFTWKPGIRQYGSGEILYVGKWPVGSVSYSANVPREDPKKYVACSRLPGLKSDLGHFEKLQDAKLKVEAATAYWFTKAGQEEEVK